MAYTIHTDEYTLYVRCVSERFVNTSYFSGLSTVRRVGFQPGSTPYEIPSSRRHRGEGDEWACERYGWMANEIFSRFAGTCTCVTPAVCLTYVRTILHTALLCHEGAFSYTRATRGQERICIWAAARWVLKKKKKKKEKETRTWSRRGSYGIIHARTVPIDAKVEITDLASANKCGVNECTLTRGCNRTRRRIVAKLDR